MGIHPADLIAETKAAIDIAAKQEAKNNPEARVGTDHVLYTENNDQEEDIPGFLTSRGLDYEMPADRRATTVVKKSALDRIIPGRRSSIKKH